MAASLNKVTLIGSLGRDPESRSFQNGGKVVNLRIATSESWKDKTTGEKKEKTEWHSVAIFNEGIGSVAERYLRKGSKVYLEGALQTRKWQDQNGADKYSTEIVLQGYDAKLLMLDGPQSSAGRDEHDQRPASEQRGGGGGGFSDDLDDDVPFITNGISREHRAR